VKRAEISSLHFMLAKPYKVLPLGKPTTTRTTTKSEVTWTKGFISAGMFLEKQSDVYNR